VIFTGRVTHDAMPGLLGAMDIGVAPYLAVPDFYFSPLKLYEYMAAGLAVVASDAGEIGTLVRDGQTGLLCPPGDATALRGALRRVVNDAAVRARLGASARDEAERHTWRENARTVARLAADAARRRGQTGSPVGHERNAAMRRRLPVERHGRRIGNAEGRPRGDGGAQVSS
jgi:glycosyltransferase involved in cell wall biosynthesis